MKKIFEERERVCKERKSGGEGRKVQPKRGNIRECRLEVKGQKGDWCGRQGGGGAGRDGEKRGQKPKASGANI